MIFLPPLIPAISFGRFSQEDLRRIKLRCLRQNHPYTALTASCPPAPELPGWLWSFDHSRIKIGHGRDDFERAAALLQRWGHFQLSWAFVNAATATIPGTILCVEARPTPLPLWVACPLKVVYNERKADVHIDLDAQAGSAGLKAASPAIAGAPAATPARIKARVCRFAHSTLEGHYLAGEERFQVEWHKDDDSVWYDVCAVSRPAHPLAVAFFPFVRFCQKRFGRGSTEAMRALMADGKA